MAVEKCLFCERMIETSPNFTEKRKRVWYDCDDCGKYSISQLMHDRAMYAVRAWAAANGSTARYELADYKRRNARAHFREALFKSYL